MVGIVVASLRVDQDTVIAAVEHEPGNEAGEIGHGERRTGERDRLDHKTRYARTVRGGQEYVSIGSSSAAGHRPRRDGSADLDGWGEDVAGAAHCFDDRGLLWVIFELTPQSADL